MSIRTSAALAALVAAAASAPLPAQENFELGKMWTFERAPVDYWEREYGFRPDAEWLQKVMLASLRFGDGCSASFVSPSGLIMTNHHCVRGNIAEAQGEADWVKDGFVAPGLGDEVRLPGLTVQQLVRATDVTEEMNRGLEGMSDEEVSRQLTDRENAILERAKAEHPDLDAQVVKLFQGAVWQLYQYRIFDDVRLVVAPHLQAGHFGGDPDNFTYPRFGIDFSFCRAYEDGKPADTSDSYFRWSQGAEPDELVFLTGNPGGTERLLTRSQLEYLRDAYLPRRRELVDNRLVIMRAISQQSAEAEKQLRTNILRYENAQKLWRGEHGALRDSAFMARKDAAESAFQARIQGNGELTARYGNLWRDLEEVCRAKTSLDAAQHFHTHGGYPPLAKGMQVLAAAEDGITADERAALLEPAAGGGLAEAFFVDHLVRALNWLPEDDPYLQALVGDRDVRRAVADLQSSRIDDAEWLGALLDSGADAVASSDDPILAAARAIRPLARRNGEAWDKIVAREEALGVKMGQALFAAYGDEVSPDATFTLRISDGRVAGYEYNGTLAPWRTTFFGMFARNAEFDNQYPFNLPDPWLLRQNRLDMAASVNFVCTVDSTGGNSGSPVVNAEREIVGLLFDGNIESLGNQYVYGEDNGERSVCVHPQAILEALTKIYDAQRVADELQSGR